MEIGFDIILLTDSAEKYSRFTACKLVDYFFFLAGSEKFKKKTNVDFKDTVL